MLAEASDFFLNLAECRLGVFVGGVLRFAATSERRALLHVDTDGRTHTEPPGPHVAARRATLSFMGQGTSELERAFQIARSGDYGSVVDIKKRLKVEGYTTARITGSALSKQLRALIQAARDPKGQEDPLT